MNWPLSRLVFSIRSFEWLNWFFNWVESSVYKWCHPRVTSRYYHYWQIIKHEHNSYYKLIPPPLSLLIIQEEKYWLSIEYCALDNWTRNQLFWLIPKERVLCCFQSSTGNHFLKIWRSYILHFNYGKELKIRPSPYYVFESGKFWILYYHGKIKYRSGYNGCHGWWMGYAEWADF